MSDPNPSVRFLPAAARELDVDVAIVAQDTARTFGPGPPLDADWQEEDEIEHEHLLDGLRSGGFRPEPLGSVLLTRPSWCSARTVLEAVVYDTARRPMVDESSLRAALERALDLALQLEAATIALEPLGTEHGQLAPARFLELLSAALRARQDRLSGVRRLLVTARDERGARELRLAFEGPAADAGG